MPEILLTSKAVASMVKDGKSFEETGLPMVFKTTQLRTFGRMVPVGEYTIPGGWKKSRFTHLVAQRPSLHTESVRCDTVCCCAIFKGDNVGNIFKVLQDDVVPKLWGSLARIRAGVFRNDLKATSAVFM